jgi:hypothetical protein
MQGCGQNYASCIFAQRLSEGMLTLGKAVNGSLIGLF